MLVRFSVENYLSIKERLDFSLIKGNGTTHSNHILPAKNYNDVAVLRSAIIYGANASGKSNLIKALAFSKKFILDGVKPDRPIPRQPFILDTSSSSKASRFEFEIKIDDDIYAYGFEINNKQVLEEWLYLTGKRKENLIFERKAIDRKEITFNFEENIDDSEEIFIQKLSESVQTNKLLLTELGVRDIPALTQIKKIYKWFQEKLVIIFPDTKVNGIEFSLEKDKELESSLTELLKYFDTGITGIELIELDFAKDIQDIPEELKQDLLEDMKNGHRIMIQSLRGIRYALYRDLDKIKAYKLMTKHTVADGANNQESINFEIKQESEGTQRLIDLIPALIMLQKSNIVIFVDELDRSLHPMLSQNMIKRFFEACNATNDSQLIITSHESSLLSLKTFRKDEIWFVEKNERGESKAYSLQDFNPRYDKDIRKGYLQGRFGAIPFIHNVKELGWTKVK
jgi:hypothetical protein